MGATHKASGFTLIELMIVVAIIGILASIAIPNFIKFQAMAKQSEAKTNLRAAFTAEKSYYAEKDVYSTEFSTIGFQVEGGNRYAYSAGGAMISQDTRYPSVTPPSGLTIAVSNGSITVGQPGVTGDVFLIGAWGNIDKDTTADVWGVGSHTALQTVGPCTPDSSGSAGTPLLVYNDITCP